MPVCARVGPTSTAAVSRSPCRALARADRRLLSLADTPQPERTARRSASIGRPVPRVASFAQPSATFSGLTSPRSHRDTACSTIGCSSRSSAATTRYGAPPYSKHSAAMRSGSRGRDRARDPRQRGGFRGAAAPRDQSASAAQRRQQVAQRIADQHQIAVGRRFFQRLQQRVRGNSVQRVGAGDHRYLARRDLRSSDDEVGNRANRVDADLLTGAFGHDPA